MDELMDLLVTDGSSSQISDKIKDILFQKSAENIEAIRPYVAASLFGDADAVGFDTSEDSEVESDVDFDQE